MGWAAPEGPLGPPASLHPSLTVQLGQWGQGWYDVPSWHRDVSVSSFPSRHEIRLVMAPHQLHKVLITQSAAALDVDVLEA